MIKDYKPELLAPAGNLTCALAAFDAGADAVYAGLPKFNARERSDNFTMEQFGALIAYARRNNKKVYLTLNTLIKEVELKDLIELLAEVAYLRPDAVIVQDLGVMQAIRTYFPELVIHASTQVGIHNSAGIAVLEKLGVSRVILERQVTVEELEEIMGKTSMEVEIFVHGALCCSLSGTCTFSSWLGGWSGNRGKCKQPCRRRFFADDGNGFFFSSQDLYTLDMIEKFKELGVASFKIEGRMKKPDYIRATVSAYKRVVDAEKVDDTVLNEARNELSKAAGRKWSHGFYTAESMEELIQHRQLGVSGTLCGDVISSENGRSFQVKVTRRLHVGDRIRLQSRTGDEAPSMTITKMFVNNKASNKAIKGEICSIPYDREVAYDAQVYRVGVATEDMDNRISLLPNFKPVVDLEIKLDSKKLTIAVKEFPIVWEHEVGFAWAENRPCDEATLIE
ncbi:MAG: peptidase U32 family protein, partial [Lentisphaeria bacterium]